MPQASIEFAEGPPLPPPDVTGIFAVFGKCSGLAAGEMATIDDRSLILSAAGYGPPCEMAFGMHSASKKRVYLMGCAASIAAVLGAVTQVGQGPEIAVSGTPHDDASVIARVSKSGPMGEAEIQLSWSSSIVDAAPVPLFQSARTVPALAPATIVGDVDLTSLDYALPAIVTGTADLTPTALYGASGSLAGRTVIAEIDGGGSATCQFGTGTSAPSNSSAAILALNTAFGDDFFSLSQQYKLRITGVVLGASGEIDITSGTALTALGLTVDTTSGTPGDLDGGTLILEEDQAVALPAVVTGTEDLSASGLYGSGGDLDATTVIANIDGAGSVTCTFGTGGAAPADRPAMLLALNNAFAGSPFALNGDEELVITGTLLGLSGSIDITGGTALTVLGLTVANTPGTPTAQTVTFGAPGSPADVVTEIESGTTNIAAEIYSTSNLLRLSSVSVGEDAELSVAGGDARTLLGLPLSVEPATGAESTITIPHLGVTMTVQDSTAFVVGTTYAFPCAAGKPDAEEIAEQIDVFVAKKIPVMGYYVATELDLASAAALQTVLDTKLGTLEDGKKIYPFVGYGVKPTEARANVKAAFSARSRRVDVYATGGYFDTSSSIPGGGSVVRSLSFGGAAVDARNPFSKDRGDHSLQPIPGLRLLLSDENDATVKLVTQTGATGMSFNVADESSGGKLYFAGGYTSADGTSLYMDQSTRNVVHRGATIAQPILDSFINSTNLDVDEKGFLTDDAASDVRQAVEAALESELVPAHCTKIRVTVDQTVNFFKTRNIRTKTVYQVRFPARSVTAIMGPGLITDTE